MAKKEKEAAQPYVFQFHRKLFPFMKMKWFFVTLSTVVFCLSLLSIVKNGFNFGVDFTGGIKLVYKFKDAVNDDQIRKVIAPLNLGDSQIVRFGNEEDNSFLIKVKFEEGVDVAKEITQKLEENFSADKVTLQSEETVGPKVGADLTRRGVFAVTLTLVLILIYIGWRFDFLFSPGAIIALIHDVVFALGLFTLLHKEFNLPILAAVLTLIGYSNNDTIIIYDRIRENLKKLPSTIPLSQLIDISLNETLSRSIITHLTVLFSMVVLFIYGGGVIHDFAFFMVVGVIVGTYSSIFVASPIYLACNRFFPNRGIVRSGKK